MLNTVRSQTSDSTGLTASQRSEEALARLAGGAAKRGWVSHAADILSAALLATAPVAPLVAALLVVAAALRDALKEPWFGYLPPVMLLPGMVYLLTAWVLLALIWALLGFTHVKRANAATYCELVNELTEAHTMLERLGASAKTTARLYVSVVASALDGTSWTRASWVLGNGYVSIWQLLHRSQEALIGLEPIDAAVSRAQYDLLRLANSNVLHSDLLCERLRQCVELLMPIAADNADLNARAGVRAVLLNAKPQEWGPSTDRTQAEHWAMQLEESHQAVSAAPIGSDRKLPLIAELQTAMRDLKTSLDADAARSATSQAPNGSSPAHDARAALEVTAAVGATSTLTAVAASEPGGSAVLAEAASGATRVAQVVQSYEVKNRQALTQQLERFVAYLSEPLSRAPGRDPSGVDTVVARADGDSVLRPPEFAAEARMVIGTIRQTLNQYRDESRAGLVRARNQLGWTTVVTALFAYTVVWLAVASSVPAEALKVGVTYFLVGALIGLFSRLHGELGADTATDDYGLTVMRLIAAPQLAGVAAVAGVGLLALTGMTASDASGGVQNSFQHAFSLPFQPGTMLAAAGFGLAPGLLIDRLKQQTENLKGNLKTTQPQGGV